ncbi:MAG: hypothetical protein K1X79_03145 [Oligoflexia bacterium]|nr:hypothetical protein [Oligoflexia bacterium]
MLPVYRSTSALTLTNVFAFTPQQIDYDWFGERMKNPPRFVVAVDPERLFLAAIVDMAPWYDSATTQGQFVEGLWNKDVAEIFLTNSGGTAYQEFNLSPRGSWWSCVFSKYRKRDPQNFKMPQGVETFSEIQQSSWKAGIAIPVRDLSIPLAIEETSRANVCFVLGKTKRHYLSWTNIQNYDPDFHRADEFEDIDVVQA